jgi:hypothetical protein
MNTAIERIEAKIANGENIEVVYPFRVYTITLSPEHLKAGADFMLAMSFKSKEEAAEYVSECNATGYQIAVLVY